MGTRLDHLQRLTSELVVATHHFTMASITPHRTPTPSVGMAGMSASELRAGMQDFLRSSGALGSLKTQLRSVITSELLRRRAPRQVMTSTDVCRGTGGNSPGVEEESEVDDAWTMRLADALVEQHLRSTERSFSLAIFSSEADVGFKAAGDGALAALLHLGVPSKPGVGDIVEDASGKQQQCKGSLLQSLASRHLESVGLRHDRPPGYSVGTQTDGDPSNGAAEGSSRPTLEVRLAAVDAKYALCFARVGESARAELERRMEVYREELKLQMEQAYQQRLRAFEQERLHEVRREAEEHYKLLLQHKIEERQEVERSSAQRVEAERARLAQAREDVYLQRMELDRRQREIQLLLDERDKATAATEEQLSEARQQIRVLTAQLQKLEELCGTRLIEVEAARDREMRRASDIRRLQAEHVAELQLKDEEVCRLRFRIRSLMTSQSRGGWRPDAAGGAEGLAAVADASPTVEGAQMGVASLATREAVWQSMWRSVDTGPCPGEAGAAVVTAALGEPSGWVEKPVDRPLNSHETQDWGVDGGPCKLLPIGGSGSTSTTTAVIAISGAACMPTTEEVALTAVEDPKPAALEGEHTLSNTNAVESRGTDRRSESRLASSRDTNSGRTERAAPSATKSQATASSRGQSGSSRMSEGLGGAAAIGLSSKTPSASSEKSHPASVPPAPLHVPREHIETLENEEGVQRHGIAKEEEQTRESIVWSATSKRNVLMLQQGSAERDEVSFVEPQPTAISDDDDDNDDILYHKGNSSSESF
ncbi:unnamed protein product [Trypanosoma congolense IL3000]|uniref:WGS project CAEQ00000000 data, annotated contig 548 n=1 Tax=Trypanosoma congolense (strain IL3000) TaxID=1068625 RepID=F9WGT8_TRYCI|nr:unnamed protein product [Trypanosoma congolense IL3000]